MARLIVTCDGAALSFDLGDGVGNASVGPIKAAQLDHAVECWASWMPHGTINPGDTTSFNHYAPGAVAKLDAPCDLRPRSATTRLREVLIQPQHGARIIHARTTHDSLYGQIELHWDLWEGELTCEGTLATGTAGWLHLPGN